MADLLFIVVFAIACGAVFIYFIRAAMHHDSEVDRHKRINYKPRPRGIKKPPPPPRPPPKKGGCSGLCGCHTRVDP